MRNDRLGLFVGAIGVVLSCKAVLALTVGGMGLWLWAERRTKYAAIALGLGTLWFIVATQWLMPAFAGEQALTRFIGRYSDLGSSYGEIVQNFFLRPHWCCPACFRSVLWSIWRCYGVRSFMCFG